MPGDDGKEMIKMERHIFIQMSKLHNVKGRINYITSTAKQENLYATYRTCDNGFWGKLAKENRADFERSGTAGECIEARELIIALPECYTAYQPQEVLKTFADFFKEHYEVECAAALHHNKKKSNYHIHLIFSERRLLTEPEEKIASRNLFYDESGKRCRTKKEILGGDGNVRIGCRIVKKGDVYERHLFEKKNPLFKSKGFVDEIKESYVKLINERVVNGEQKLSVYEKGSIYLPMKKIGKNNPNARNIEANNRAVLKWNDMAARVLADVPPEGIKAIKRNEIIKPLGAFSTGRKPIGNKFEKTVDRAVKTLRNFTLRWIGIQPDRRPGLKSEGFYRLLDMCRAKMKKGRNRGWER